MSISWHFRPDIAKANSYRLYVIRHIKFIPTEAKIREREEPLTKEELRETIKRLKDLGYL